MNATSAAVLTGLIVVAGNWSQGKPMTMRIAIGIVAMTLFLTILNESVPEVANKLAVLVVVSAVFLYGMPIAKKAGLIK